MQTTDYPTRAKLRDSYSTPSTPAAGVSLSATSLESHASFALPLLERGLEVLDVGCGAGTITRSIAEIVLPGRVTGVDRDPAQVARASRLAEGREQTNARFVAASAYELPFPAASFDLVLAHALFEHLSNPRGALAEIRRVLRPGGLVALGSPDWDAFEMRMPTSGAEAAIRSYRELQERDGGDLHAGGRLVNLLQDGEFGLIRKGQRFESYESPMRIATFIAMQLEAAGDTAAARELLDWSTEPGAELIGCWKHAIAIKWNR